MCWKGQRARVRGKLGLSFDGQRVEGSVAECASSCSGMRQLLDLYQPQLPIEALVAQHTAAQHMLSLWVVHSSLGGLCWGQACVHYIVIHSRQAVCCEVCTYSMVCFVPLCLWCVMCRCREVQLWRGGGLR